MSPRKRLSPTTSQPKYSVNDEASSTGGPPALPSLATTTRPSMNHRPDEKRLIRLLCWMTVAMTMAALALVFVVEQERDRKLHGGAESNGNNEPSTTTTTYHRRAMNLVFQTHSQEAPMCTPLAVDDVAFTLVTQCSDSRLWMMKHHCQRWRGPISLVVYTNHTQQFIERQLYQMKCNNDRVAVQIHPADNMVDYPINALRNMALTMVQTSHAFYIDVDFWPAVYLHDVLTLHKEYLATDFRRALVVPAFSLSRQCKEWRECPEQNIPIMPRTQQDVYDGLVQRRISPFDPTNRGGHGSTRYQEWLSQTANDLLSIDCFQSNRYEPYLVVRYCQDLPPFQEGFTGYGKNKVSWVTQLRRAGWTFAQVGQAFVVHYPHLDSPARQAWNGAPKNAVRRTGMMRRPSDDAVLMQTKRGVTDQLFVEFRNWLDEMYPPDSKRTSSPAIRTPLCEEAADDDAKLWVAREHIL